MEPDTPAPTPKKRIPLPKSKTTPKNVAPTLEPPIDLENDGRLRYVESTEVDQPTPYVDSLQRSSIRQQSTMLYGRPEPPSQSTWREMEIKSGRLKEGEWTGETESLPPPKSKNDGGMFGSARDELGLYQQREMDAELEEGGTPRFGGGVGRLWEKSGQDGGDGTKDTGKEENASESLEDVYGGEERPGLRSGEMGTTQEQSPFSTALSPLMMQPGRPVPYVHSLYSRPPITSYPLPPRSKPGKRRNAFHIGDPEIEDSIIKRRKVAADKDLCISGNLIDCGQNAITGQGVSTQELVHQRGQSMGLSRPIAAPTRPSVQMNSRGQTNRGGIIRRGARGNAIQLGTVSSSLRQEVTRGKSRDPDNKDDAGEVGE